MYNFGYVIIKVGDKQNKLGVKDGFVLQFIDPNEYDNPENLISDRMKKVYCIIKVPIEWKNDILDWATPNMDITELNENTIPDTYRASKKLVTFSELETILGINGLEENLRAKDVKVEIIDGMNLDISIFKSSDTLNSPAIDNNVVSSGTYYVGSGYDYLNWKAVADDIDVTLTGDLTFIQKTDVSDSAQCVFTTDLNGHTLTFSSDNPPWGDPTAGNKSTFSYVGSQFYFNTITGTGTVIFRYMNFNSTVSAGTSAIVYLFTIDSTVTFKVYDNMLKGNNYLSPFKVFDTSFILRFFNNVCWNAANGGGFEGRSLPTDCIIENNTCYGNLNGIDCSLAVVTVRNNLCFGNTNDFYEISGANGYNNASQDTSASDVNWASGSNNQISITPSNEVETTDDTLSNFMKCKKGGVCENGGTTVSISENDHGNRNNARPHCGNYSIGADEYLILSSSGGKFGSMGSNLKISNGIIQTCQTATDNFRIGDFITNAYVNDGKLAVELNGTADHFLTIQDEVTNIALTQNGKVVVNNNISNFDHYAIMFNFKTNIPLTKEGAIIATTSGTPDEKIKMQDFNTNMYKANGYILISNM